MVEAMATKLTLGGAQPYEVRPQPASVDTADKRVDNGDVQEYSLHQYTNSTYSTYSTHIHSKYILWIFFAIHIQCI